MSPAIGRRSQRLNKTKKIKEKMRSTGERVEKREIYGRKSGLPNDMESSVSPSE